MRIPVCFYLHVLLFIPKVSFSATLSVWLCDPHVSLCGSLSFRSVVVRCLNEQISIICDTFLYVFICMYFYSFQKYHFQPPSVLLCDPHVSLCGSLSFGSVAVRCLNEQISIICDTFLHVFICMYFYSFQKYHFQPPSQYGCVTCMLVCVAP